MPTDITLQMCIDEVQRTITSRDKSYKDFVSHGKMSPYTRDNRQAIMKTLLRILENAKAERKKTTFVQLINQLP